MLACDWLELGAVQQPGLSLSVFESITALYPRVINVSLIVLLLMETQRAGG